jgi:glycosyltransferase involved in cell wall biosynthesis
LDKVLYLTNLKLKESSGEMTHIVGVINSFIKKNFDIDLITFETNEKLLRKRNLSNKVNILKINYKINNLISSLFLFFRFYFLNKKEYKYIYIRESFLCLLLIPYLLTTKKKVIFEINGIRVFEEKRFLKSQIIKLSKFLTNILFKKSYKIIAVSEGIRDFIKDTYHIKNVYTVHNGTDLKPKNFTDKKDNSLIFIGNLSKWQNFNLLIDSIKIHKDYFENNKISVSIYGDGEEKERIINNINNNQLDNIILIKGKINKELIIDVLLKSKIGLLIDTRFYKKELLFSPLKYFEYQVAQIPSIMLVEKNIYLDKLKFDNLLISTPDTFLENIKELFSKNNLSFKIRNWDIVVDEILNIVE